MIEVDVHIREQSSDLLLVDISKGSASRLWGHIRKCRNSSHLDGKRWIERPTANNSWRRFKNFPPLPNSIYQRQVFVQRWSVSNDTRYFSLLYTSRSSVSISWLIFKKFQPIERGYVGSKWEHYMKYKRSKNSKNKNSKAGHSVSTSTIQRRINSCSALKKINV